jgi:hypothetical protein
MSGTWADDEEEVTRQVNDTGTAAPAADVSETDSEPPADAAGAAPDKEEEYPPGVVPAGQPLVEAEPEEPPADSVWLKVAGAHSELEIIGAHVTDEYQAFTPQQAAVLRDSAVAQGVTLIDKSEEVEV